jgi:hypothetical protein
MVREINFSYKYPEGAPNQNSCYDFQITHKIKTQNLWFFSCLVAKKDSRIQGFQDSRVQVFIFQRLNKLL